jgi:putative ABC transport system substrate-binding protein
MQRREFIKVIAGSAVAWPLVARAQQPAMPVVGFIHSASASYLAPFMFSEGLRLAGLPE